MKDRAIQYLAMDVHQATTVACVRNERGAITMRATVPTEERAIVALVRGAGSRVHVAFEEGRKPSGCTTCCSPTPSGWWSATCAARARLRTRAIASTRSNSPRCCASGR